MCRDAGPTTSLSLLVGLRNPQDNEAWTEFVGRYQPLITRWCARLGLQQADAEDVAQEILLKLVRFMETFEYDPSCSFRAWLHTVTDNTVKDFLKSNQRRRTVLAGETTIERLLSAAKPTDSGEELIDALTAEMRHDLIEEAERRVRPRVNLRTWAAYFARSQDVPARQVASALSMRVAAVHKAKSRVVRMIRREIAILLSGRGCFAESKM